jgi:uroporphyrinogen decarboxylase
MKSRERVLSTIEHKGADRMPYDFWSENATLERLYKYAGHRDLEKLLKTLNVDVRHIQSIMPEEKNNGRYYENFWGERFIFRQTEWGPVREDLDGALTTAQTMEDLKNFDWPTPEIFDYSNLKAVCKEFDEYAMIYGYGDIWQRPCLVRGLQNAMMDMAIQPEWMHFLSRKYTDFYKEDYTRAWKASGGRIDMFLIFSDLGGQNSTLISPEMFDEFVRPYLKEITDHIHNLGAKIFYHSCGMIYPFIPKFIELGIDVLDPIQPSNELMSPENLGKSYGGKICFHGGIDVQKVLPYFTPEQVKTEVKRYHSNLGKKGGYICCSTHFLQPDNSPENIFAMYQAFD